MDCLKLRQFREVSAGGRTLWRAIYCRFFAPHPKPTIKDHQEAPLLVSKDEKCRLKNSATDIFANQQPVLCDHIKIVLLIQMP